MLKIIQVYDGLQLTTDARKEHNGRLSELAKDPQHAKLFEHLYDCLTILDQKSSSMLQFNSIMMAIMAIFLVQQDIGQTARILLLLGLYSTMVSSAMLLWVIWVQWSVAQHMVDPVLHGETLLRKRNERTVLYRFAWNFAVLGVFLVAAFGLAVYVVPR